MIKSRRMRSVGHVLSRGVFNSIQEIFTGFYLISDVFKKA
jgi:hypothetical protein